jgi:hypothetical protein
MTKQLLNERVLGLAGIIPLKPIGFYTNSTISEDINEMASSYDKRRDYWEFIVKSIKRIDSELESGNHDMGHMIHRLEYTIADGAKKGLYSMKDAVKFIEYVLTKTPWNQETIAYMKDAMEDLSAKSKSAELNESVDKELLNERMLGLAGVTTLKPIGFFSNSVREHAIDPSQQGYEQDETPTIMTKREYWEHFVDMIKRLDGAIEEGNESTVKAYVDALVDSSLEGAKRNIFKPSEAVKFFSYVRDKSPWNEKTKELISNVIHSVNDMQMMGAVNEVTTFKPHGKDLISERAMGMLGLITLKPIAPLAMPANAIKTIKSNTITEVKICQRIAMLHNNVIMQLSEEVLKSPYGKRYDKLVDELSEAYDSDASKKEIILNVLKSFNLV